MIHKNQTITRKVFYLVIIAFIYFVIFSLQRYALYWTNLSVAKEVDPNYINKAFLIGIRFDLMVVSYTFLPVIVGSVFLRGTLWQKIINIWLYLVLIFMLLMGIIEIEFYHEFHARLNSMVFEYIKEDPKTVISMIVSGLPVIRYLVIFFIVAAALCFIFKKTARMTQGKDQSNYFLQSFVFLIILGICVIGARGGKVKSGPPLRWGDAYVTDQLFSNQLALNPIFTLVKAALKPEDNKWWVSYTDSEKAVKVTQNLIESNDQFLTVDDQVGDYPVYRKHTPKNAYHYPIKNIVVVMMESFGADHIGAINQQSKITPNFDQMTKDGLLFTRFFSSGTHTHQGMFATFASWPNLPGYEYLMQQVEGQGKFSAFTQVLKRDIDNSIYVYNGDFSWDNQRGFFSNQGMKDFVGQGDFENPQFVSKTWGVSDQDMFNQAVIELDQLSAKNKPFFAVIQTLSNHLPFDLPEPLPVNKILDENGHYSARLTAMHYADWAVGQFYQTVKQKPYYKDTLFVFLGDHSFTWKTPISDLDLTRFHIPLLLIAPEIQETFGKRTDIVGSQVDVMPTAVSLLLEKPFKHQGWGRDLLSLEKDDHGYAIIKPSGSDPRVGMISGDYLLTLLEHENPSLWQYDPLKRKAHKVENQPIKKKLNNFMRSYIETAILSLQNETTGIPDS